MADLTALQYSKNQYKNKNLTGNFRFNLLFSPTLRGTPHVRPLFLNIEPSWEIQTVAFDEGVDVVPLDR